MIFTVLQIVIGLLALLALYRILVGPSLADRIVGFDLLTLQVLGIICLEVIIHGTMAFFDAALILVLLSFLATLAFARGILRGAGHE